MLERMSVTSTSAEWLSRCPVCDRSNFKELALPKGWLNPPSRSPAHKPYGLCKCKSCGFVFANPRPPAGMVSLYARTAGAALDMPELTDREAERLLERIEEHVGAVGRLLDVGCKRGKLLERARARGWNARGYDGNPNHLAVCRQKGLNVTDSFGNFKAGQFDVVLLNHVLEYDPNHRDVLARVGKLLAPGGCLFIEVPNARSFRSTLSKLTNHRRPIGPHGAYLSYFSRRTLRRLIESAGFSVDAVESLRRRFNGRTRTHKRAPQRLLEPLKSRLERVMERSMRGDDLLAVAHDPAARQFVSAHVRPVSEPPRPSPSIGSGSRPLQAPRPGAR